MKKEKIGNLIKKAIKETKIKILLILIAVIIVALAGIFLLAREASKYSLENAVFYFKTLGENTKLFYLEPGVNPQFLIEVPSEEVSSGKYKVPKHGYISHDGQKMVFFERVKEVPVELVNKEKNLMAFRIIYQPKYIDLKSQSVKEIKQNIDAGSVAFSPDDKEIAWVLRVDEATVEQLEAAKKKREVWLSNPNGTKARKLATLDEKVVLLQRWQGNYLYFWGIQRVGYYSLGRIDVRNGQVSYIHPKYCSEHLANCQNFRFSPSGKLLIYEAGIVEKNNREKKENKGKKKIGLFVEGFDGKSSWQILVENYISDRLWMPDEKYIIYTEQVPKKNSKIEERIHLVNLETKEDKEIYSGSYISQIVPDASSQYLYFLEKETDQKFNLKRLNTETGEAKIIDSGPYNQFRIFSANQL